MEDLLEEFKARYKPNEQEIDATHAQKSSDREEHYESIVHQAFHQEPGSSYFKPRDMD